MGVFKNGVGRPSNETIKKRNIFKVICVLLILVMIFEKKLIGTGTFGNMILVGYSAD